MNPGKMPGRMVISDTSKSMVSQLEQFQEHQNFVVDQGGFEYKAVDTSIFNLKQNSGVVTVTLNSRQTQRPKTRQHTVQKISMDNKPSIAQLRMNNQLQKNTKKRIGGRSYEYFADVVQRKKQNQATGIWQKQYHIVPDLPSINQYNDFYSFAQNKKKSINNLTQGSKESCDPQGGVKIVRDTKTPNLTSLNLNINENLKNDFNDIRKKQNKTSMGLLNEIQPKLLDLQTNGSTQSKIPSDSKNHRNFQMAKTPLDTNIPNKDFSRFHVDHRVNRTGSVSIVENIDSISKNQVYHIASLIDYKKVKTIKQQSRADMQKKLNGRTTQQLPHQTGLNAKLKGQRAGISGYLENNKKSLCALSESFYLMTESNLPPQTEAYNEIPSPQSSVIKKSEQNFMPSPEKNDDLVRYESEIYEQMHTSFYESQQKQSAPIGSYNPSNPILQQQARMKQLNSNLKAGKNLMKGKILDKLNRNAVVQKQPELESIFDSILKNASKVPVKQRMNTPAEVDPKVREQEKLALARSMMSQMDEKFSLQNRSRQPKYPKLSQEDFGQLSDYQQLLYKQRTRKYKSLTKTNSLLGQNKVVVKNDGQDQKNDEEAQYFDQFERLQIMHQMSQIKERMTMVITDNYKKQKLEKENEHAESDGTILNGEVNVVGDIEIKKEKTSVLDNILGDVGEESHKLSVIEQLEEKMGKLVKDLQTVEDEKQQKLMTETALRLKEAEVDADKESCCGHHHDVPERLSLRDTILKYSEEIKEMAKIQRIKRPSKKNDMQFLMRVKIMIDAVHTIMPDFNLGLQYVEIDRNLFAKDEYTNNDDKISLDSSDLFSEEQKKQEFYDKARKIVTIDEDDEKEAAENASIQQYLASCNKFFVIPVPGFALIQNNSLVFIEQKINEDMANVMQDFLSSTNLDMCPQNVIKSVYFIDSNFTDGTMSKILKGILAQHKFTKSKKMITFLQTFVSTNNDIGKLSIPLLIKLLPSLQSIQISKPGPCFTSQLAANLFDACQDSNVKVQWLNFSRMSLNDLQFIEKLCEVVIYKPTLSHLDVSWCNLSPKLLARLSEELKMNARGTIRWLNLSYNMINMNNAPEASGEFYANLIAFLEDNEELVHLDLSGMCWQKDQLMAITSLLSQDSADNLLSIHLSDNAICSNLDLKGQILDLFGIQDKTEDNAQNSEEFLVNPPLREPQMLRDLVSSQVNPIKSKGGLSQQKGVISEQDLKHSLKLQKLRQKVKVDMTKVRAGISSEKTFDEFILHRQQNAPELIFNQSIDSDKYFDAEAGDTWQQIDASGCYVCHHHQLVVIYYQQNQSKETYSQFNKGLEEIYPFKNGQRTPENQERVDEIKQQMGLEDVPHEKVPYICGSVVKNPTGKSFYRKLKMMRADLFTLMTISQSKYFVKTWKQAKSIQRGVMEFVKESRNQDMKMPELEKKLVGWQQILHDKSKKNEITGAQEVNLPADMERAIKFEKTIPFVYVSFLPPGIHQMLIFCPLTDRLFCKEIVVGVNTCEILPQFPEQPPKQKKKKVRANVWRAWKDDPKEILQLAFLQDVASGIEPHLFVKEEEDIEKSKEVILQNFRMIKFVFAEFQARSNEYPEVAADVFLDLITLQNETVKKLKCKDIESCFQEATRRDNAGYLEGSLSRAELIETLMRMAMKTKLMHSKLYQELQPFLNRYVKPFFQKSEILTIRTQLRASKKLNVFLWENRVSMLKIFDTYKDMEEKKQFTLESADKLVNYMVQDDGQIKPIISKNSLLKWNFVYSKMTVVDDQAQRGKERYFYIVYVEFLEMMCRVAIRVFPGKDESPVHKKVQALFARVFKHVTDEGVLENEKEQLIIADSDDDDSD